MFQGSVSYVPQLAWVQQGSVKDNILFSQPYQRGKYEDVLEACALVDDLKLLPAGDQTELGENVRFKLTRVLS